MTSSQQLPSSSGSAAQQPQHIITFTTSPTRWVMQGATVNGLPFTLSTGVPCMTLTAPQTVLQTLVSSSCDTQVDKVTTTSTPAVTSSSSVTRIGSDPCSAPIATLSMKELRLRGSSFLRSHASHHGIPNASRFAKQVINQGRHSPGVNFINTFCHLKRLNWHLKHQLFIA